MYYLCVRHVRSECALPSGGVGWEGNNSASLDNFFVARSANYTAPHAVADIANQYHSSASRHFNNTLGRQNRAFMDER